MRCQLEILVAALFLTPTVLLGERIEIAPAKDNTIFSESTNSSGAGVAFISGRTGGGALRRGLLEFDIAGSIPESSVITSAELNLFLDGSSQSENETRLMGLHRVTSEWGEGVSGGGGAGGGQGNAPTATDATWLHRTFDTALWSTAGGDFVSTASSTVGVGTAREVYTWPSTLELTTDVQSWLDDPTSNHGWILIGDESTNNTARRFGSREANDMSLRPTLAVEYQQVPEPSSAFLSLVALLSLCMIARRELIS